MLTWIAVPIVICGQDAAATTKIPVDLQYCARHAAAIFAGTVRRLETVQANHTILTRVDFSYVSVAKGGPNWGRTRITYEGGTVGNTRVFAAGQPEFVPGNRYILLVRPGYGSEPWYLPIMGVDRGFFRVVRDGESSIVLDAGGRSVVGFDGSQLVVASREGGKSSQNPIVRVLSAEEDPGVRMTEREFLRALRALAAD